MFIDEVNLKLKAGKGGDGVISWLHEKGKDRMGPAGGNGGRGGSVYARAIRDVGVLNTYRNIKEMEAKNGQNGMKKNMYGEGGKDLEIAFPIGSVLTNLETKEKIELLKDEERVLLLKGGRGGFGNAHFKSSKNISPQEFTYGEPGEEAEFLIELELVVDLGLVGFPNAGKSSLLNVLTNAQAKVGSFPFTTLEPQLGDMESFILGDIPGLIEGASAGKGLGHKFLRHIKRTKRIAHCISLESEDVEAVYKTVRKELEDFSRDVSDKKEIIILTKTDLVSKEEVEKAKKILKKYNSDILAVSIYDAESVDSLKSNLVDILK